MAKDFQSVRDTLQSDRDDAAKMTEQLSACLEEREHIKTFMVTQIIMEALWKFAIPPTFSKSFTMRTPARQGFFSVLFKQVFALPGVG